MNLLKIAQKIKTAEWFYRVMMRFCRDVLGADDLYFPVSKQFV